MAALYLIGTAAAAGGGFVALRLLGRLPGKPSTATPDPSAAPPTAPASADEDLPAIKFETADRTVCIIDNGGRPFVVHMSFTQKIATVCNTANMTASGDGIPDYKTCNNVLQSFRYERVFIGLDPNELEAKGPNGAAIMAGTPSQQRARGSQPAAAAAAGPVAARWWHGGNSVLLDLGARRYVFVGMYISSFTTPDDIIRYVSTMGNNAVPYPFAVGTQNTYFLVEDTYIPNHVMERFSPEDRVDPYDVLYGDDIGRWLPGADPRDPPVEKAPGAMSLWRKAFPLPDFKMVRQREW